jgi:hypothetical protein
VSVQVVVRQLTPERIENGEDDEGTDEKPASEGNRYTRAARVLAKNDTIDVKTLADRAFMSETTAARCLEAWRACVAALIEVGRLPDPAKDAAKKTAAKKPPKAATPVAKGPAATETTAETPPAVEPVGTAPI